MFLGGFCDAFWCLFFSFLGGNLELENSVWTAQAWSDRMCDRPQGQRGLCYLSCFFGVFCVLSLDIVL